MTVLDRSIRAISSGEMYGRSVSYHPLLNASVWSSVVNDAIPDRQESSKLYRRWSFRRRFSMPHFAQAVTVDPARKPPAAPINAVQISEPT
jgi:hypothetical protein